MIDGGCMNDWMMMIMNTGMMLMIRNKPKKKELKQITKVELLVAVKTKNAE